MMCYGLISWLCKNSLYSVAGLPACPPAGEKPGSLEQVPKLTQGKAGAPPRGL